MVFPYLRLQR